MAIPEHCRTDQLYLLIGGNPLPNYVAARLLLKDASSTLRLVYTPQVKEIVFALRELLARAYGLTNVLQIEVPEAGDLEIAERIRLDLRSVPKAHSVGLHYTGGTKAMVAHAYHVMREEERIHGRTLVFSYLEARRMTLHLEPLSGPRPAPVSLALWPLPDPPRFEHLAALHFERVKRAPVQKALLPKLASRLAKHLQDAKVARQWRSWCGPALKQGKFGYIQSANGKQQAVAPWPDTTSKEFHLLGPLCTTLADLSGQVGQAHFNLDAAADTLHIERSELTGWLDGGWLEDYVLEAVQQVKTRAQLHDAGRSLLTADASHNYELDVVAMRGYRLFVISCSTVTDTSAGKSKLFEAMIRATQLGGSEARIALVALHDNPSKLQHEVSAQWETGEQVKVFGAGHLLELPQLLERWFITGE